MQKISYPSSLVIQASTRLLGLLQGLSSLVFHCRPEMCLCICADAKEVSINEWQ